MVFPLAFYNAFLGVYQHAGNLQKMVQLQTEMADAGIAPDVTTFNTLLRYTANMRDHAMIESVLSDMDAAQILPNAFSMQIMVGVHVHSTMHMYVLAQAVLVFAFVFL